MRLYMQGKFFLLPRQAVGIGAFQTIIAQPAWRSIGSTDGY